MLGFEAICDEQVPVIVKSQKVIVELPPHLENLTKFNNEVLIES
jgi:hypothetical protein